MHTTTSILFTAFMLGLVGGAIPGPVLTSIMTEILQDGFLRSMRVLVFAMIVETTIRFVATLLAGVLPVDGFMFNILSIVGACILLIIARKVWYIRAVGMTGVHIELRDLGFMIVCNGMLWTYWLTVCAPDALRLSHIMPFGTVLYLGVFEIGWILSTFGMSCVFASFRSLLTHPKIMPILFKCFSLVFVAFALKMVVGSMRILM